jgi:hypothetical protein
VSNLTKVVATIGREIKSALTGSHNWKGPFDGSVPGTKPRFVCANCGREMGKPADQQTFHSHCPYWDKPSPFRKK